MSTDPIVQSLQNYSSCDVADALLKLNHPLGGFIPDITMWSPTRQDGPTKIIGPAYTVEYVPKTDTDAPTQKDHFIDHLPPHSILLLSSPPHSPTALLGGLLALRARSLSCQGAIVDGRVRDLAELRALGFPVFARDVGTTSSRGLLRVGGVGGEVRVGGGGGGEGVRVKGGDYLVADLNGVVCVPRGVAGEVVGLVGWLVERDELIWRDLEGGAGFAESCRVRRG
ncbi:ribonuclease E inhibitor RraA/Dimethylmenaquinone methyltransferase [Usnea florida]